MACISKRRGRLVIDFYDQTGKRRWETLEKGISKKNARKRLGEIERMIEKRTFIPSRKAPGFSEVADSWLAMKKLNLRHSTYDQYSGAPGAPSKALLW
jgi:hypothetical protein